MENSVSSFRKTLGCFATGVAIVTTRTPSGRMVGLTANSFNSLSLDPPLVLWSLRSASANLLAFKSARVFAINLLSDAQKELSQRFADPRIDDKFDGLQIDRGVHELPLLRDCLARFECSTECTYTLGDHELFVGRVDNHERVSDFANPLIFCKGQYLPSSSERSAVLV